MDLHKKLKNTVVVCPETRLPLEPLEGLDGYQFEVKSPYPENNDNVIEMAQEAYQRELDEYPQRVEEAKRNYEEALANYDFEGQQARENFKLESEEFNKLSAVERLALADQKPVLRLPSKPYYREPSKPYYREPNLSQSIVYPQSMIEQFIRLEGFDQGGSNVLEGKIEIYPFENLSPERKFEEKTVYNSKTKQSSKQKVYYYLTSYKHSAFVELSYQGQVLFSGIVEGTKEYKVLRTDNSPNMTDLEKQSMEETMLLLNDFINSKYGYSKIERPITVEYVKNKKGEYDDLEEAMRYAQEGLASFDYHNWESNEALLQALEIWKAALAEGNPEDKKARINGKVMESIWFDLVETYMATLQLEQAEEGIKALEDFKLNYTQKKRIEELRELMLDRKQRLAAQS